MNALEIMLIIVALIAAGMGGHGVGYARGTRSGEARGRRAGFTEGREAGLAAAEREAHLFDEMPPVDVRVIPRGAEYPVSAAPIDLSPKLARDVRRPE